jgi:hypothetical protein
MDELLAAMSFPAHVQQALREGKLWRAKEILRGRIGSLPYSPELYEQYGVVLLAMDDLLQAGKYLFLSGARRSEYETAIDVYLTRHGARGGTALASSFPSRAKAISLTALPQNVQRELVARGLDEKKAAESIARASVPFRARAGIALFASGCFVLLVLAVASLIVGLPIVVSKVWSWVQ